MMEEEGHEEGVTRQNEVYKKFEGATISGYPFTSCQLLIKHYQAGSGFAI